MEVATLEKKLSSFHLAIEGCLEARLIVPALVLIYCLIDTLSWLGSDKEDTTRSDFVDWVERFMSPEKNLKCKAIDLYAARCGLVHQANAESRLQRQGEAAMIVYGWGDVDVEKYERLITELSEYDAIPIHAEELFASVQKGQTRFFRELKKDQASWAKALEKSTKFFRVRSTREFEEKGVDLRLIK